MYCKRTASLRESEKLFIREDLTEYVREVENTETKYCSSSGRPKSQA